jgi:hypothetical protein
VITTERRLVIKGWKDDSYTGQKHKEFVDIHLNPYESTIARQRARVGEYVKDDWQPHITEVILEEREVTEWREVKE